MSYADPYTQDADRRRADLARKLSLLRSLRLELQADALLLSLSANVAWLTNGARTYVNMATDGGVGSVYIDATSVRVLTNEIEGHRLLNEELRGLESSFSVHADPWHAQRPHPQVATEFAAAATGNAGPKVLVDASSPELAGRLSHLRVKLSDYEMDAFRSLGAECGRVIGEVARGVKPGMSEWEAASALAAGLLAKEITPVVLLVAADERADTIRHPLPTQKRVKNKLMLVLCGRRHGLICSATRVVYLTTSPDEKIPDELLRRHDAATYVDAVAIAASRHVGTPANEVLKKIQDAYAAKGFPDEWTKHHQGGCTAFLSREWVANPALTDRTVETSMAFAWNPSVAGTKSEDTILVTQREDAIAEVEVISPTPDWPMLEHQVDGQTVTRPAILHLKF